MRLSSSTSAFYERIATTAGLPPAAIAYVGDRLDNDILPDLDDGFATVFLRRGPWGTVNANWPQTAQATLTVDSREDLPLAH